MTIDTFIKKLKSTPEAIEFSETMSVIEAHYHFTPSAFTNGTLENAEGQNSGSCKLFAFAKDQKLSKEETLACFGSYYFNDVLDDPEGTGHQNIRNFMQTGFQGLVFSQDPLKKK
ncbi:HopJ type III effector protein [Zobellia galactanivorans]|uniref:HopJ type III effector protein n=1 Tax=Zobellia galactanivorans (strain DSM 12802 / CCUG 47099 / CIP 106680 / NCIMB 13871 / Dsij) TaxID=63186 RepID=UPI0026E39AA7|nr:HopJ type III effector protein [Zobellia galactanivorans]MDO6808228.1 HopJ type III effector protein [Zobellia galactanivorans]